MIAEIIFKVVPLVLPIILSYFSENFGEAWEKVAKTYRSNERYRNYLPYTVFAYDRYHAVYSISLSFAYAVLVITAKLAAPASLSRTAEISLYLLTAVMVVGIIIPVYRRDQWFDYSSGEGDPTLYYRYHYLDESNDRMEELYAPRWFSPRWYSTYTSIALIGLVILVELI